MEQKNFEFFLFENFDASDILTENNPRTYLNHSITGILSDVVNAVPFTCRYQDMCSQYTSERINNLIKIGLFRTVNDMLLLDSTVIVREDIKSIRDYLEAEITCLADKIVCKQKEIYCCVGSIKNGFDEKMNLYHLLCGAVFDGDFFDYLRENQLLITSRLHTSGVDYIITVYEKCPELSVFSNHLLCSYNRFCDGTRALQSFGDADGSRVDFYRFNCQKQLGVAVPAPKEINQIWNKASCNHNFKSYVLNELRVYDETGFCDRDCMQLFEYFGYISGNQYTVPVFRQNAKSIIQRLSNIVIDCIGIDIKKLLSDSPIMFQLYCRRHGVPKEEVANEVYHMIFGMLNEELVSRGFVQMPDFHVGEGRYLKSIELYNNESSTC